jgi:CBS domain-containing protein
MSGRLFVCRPTDDIHAALKTMRIRKVRRLPVINHEGKLEGLLTMSEIILQAFHDDGRAKRPDVSYEDVMGTLIGIHLHHIRAVASCGEQVPHRSHAA